MAWRPSAWDTEGWRASAACREVDADIFFASGEDGRAKAFCASCPVAEECLIFAVTTNQEYGVWGGLDEEERRQVRRVWKRSLLRRPLATVKGPPAAGR